MARYMCRMAATFMRASESCSKSAMPEIRCQSRRPPWRIALATLVLACTAALTRAEATQHCPAGLPAGASCYAGQDSNGAYYWIVVPEHWNHVLVVHSHGGPSLKRPVAEDPLSDLQRFAVTVTEGFAWAGSSYRHAGYGVRDAAQDTDNLRQIFWSKFGRPRYTLLHGQSWGANVAAKAAELYGSDASGKPVYDGVILTSGVLGGGTRSYDFRVDLRVVYQYFCKNHPAADEPAYPLWQGLPADSKLRPHDLDERINSCTGVELPEAARSPTQKRALANILAVVHIPERTLASHMNWATFTFRDLVQRQLRGENPFSTTGVRYVGSDDDTALNAAVERFTADPSGVRDLAYDSDLSGKLTVPTLTMHAEDDPTAFVELESTFHDTVAKAGSNALLVQSFTDEHEHSKLATPEYAALFRAMLRWITDGQKASPATLAADCAVTRKIYGEDCHFDPGFQPRPLGTRVYSRLDR
jgi:pimeloyl-ACP methyl ester carboxylesterase